MDPIGRLGPNVPSWCPVDIHMRYIHPTPSVFKSNNISRWSTSQLSDRRRCPPSRPAAPRLLLLLLLDVLQQRAPRARILRGTARLHACAKAKQQKQQTVPSGKRQEAGVRFPECRSACWLPRRGTEGGDQLASVFLLLSVSSNICLVSWTSVTLTCVSAKSLSRPFSPPHLPRPDPYSKHL